MVYDEIARIKTAENDALAILSHARRDAEQFLIAAREEAVQIHRKSEEDGWNEVLRIRDERQKIAALNAVIIRQEGGESAAALRIQSAPKLDGVARHIVNRIVGISDVLPF